MARAIIIVGVMARAIIIVGVMARASRGHGQSYI